MVSSNSCKSIKKAKNFHLRAKDNRILVFDYDMLLTLLRVPLRAWKSPCRSFSIFRLGAVSEGSGFAISRIGSVALCRNVLLVSKSDARWIRSRGNDRDFEHHTRSEHEKESSSNGQNEGTPNPEEANKDKPKVDPALLRKLRIYVLVVGCMSFVMSFLILSQMSLGQAQAEGLLPEHLTSYGIDMKSFVDKYLKAGEVRRIIFCPDYSRAVAFLYEGAIIDGRQTRDPVVVVAYPKDATQFWSEIRKEEEDMGIAIANGVKLEMYRGLTTFRTLELLVGIMIIAWLGTQYGRLLRQRYLANKQKSGGSSP
ncbi:unnamed protein product [Cylicocyclus nassatus]|uniref:Uncharacterized protein n=1 Tax=Cylicocyclus nassatus TaxID=53992 RepID=A0AA36MCD5_CYLNA|nr:unnamed protein product [Cylicocyclus nassatus]